LFIVSSCRKDLDQYEVTTDKNPPTVFIETTIRGQVVDESGIALANVTVNVENEWVQSDDDGNFIFQKATVKKLGNIVTASASGYFTGVAHSIFPADGASFVEIRMLERGAPQSMQSSSGINYTTEDNIQVSIPAGAVALANGSAYSGSVNVYTKWIDPTDENLGTIMPGALNATDENGRPIVLASFGMVALDLETENGSKLELSADASIEIPIPPSLLEDAPNEIPLWLFDLETGEWLENGVCKKEGNTYKCKVPKTGYWNCDVPLPAICLSAQVFNPDSTFAPYVKVIVEDLTDNFIYWGYTDSTGLFCGSVPQAALLQLTIKDHCDNIVFMEEIGPFAEDLQLEDIYLTESIETFVFNIIGMVSHCISNDVPNGHVAVTYPGRIRIFPFETGGFDLDLAVNCIAFPELKIRTYSASQPNATPEFAFTEFSDIDLESQQTCEDLTDVFNLNVDGDTFWTAPTQYYLKNNTTTDWMVLEGLSGGGKFVLELRDYQGVGSYASNVFFNTTNEIFSPFYPVLTTSSPNVSVTITIDDGSFIEGNLSGTAIDNDGLTRNVNGDFKIRKAP